MTWPRKSMSVSDTLLLSTLVGFAAAYYAGLIVSRSHPQINADPERCPEVTIEEAGFHPSSPPPSFPPTPFLGSLRVNHLKVDRFAQRKRV